MRASQTLIIPLPAVPSPTTTIFGITNTSQLAGSSLELSCIVELVPEVDTGISVIIRWKRHNEQIDSDPRISVSSAIEVNAFIYQSELQINVLSLSIDNGNYTCDVILSSSPPSEYVQDVTTSVTETITVQSKPLFTCNLCIGYSLLLCT